MNLDTEGSFSFGLGHVSHRTLKAGGLAMSARALRGFLVSLSALSVLLGSCAPATTEPGGAPVATQPGGAPVVAPTAAEPVKMTVSVVLSGPAFDTWQTLWQKLQDDHPEWELQLDNVPFGEQGQKLVANAAAGTLPDVQMFLHFYQGYLFESGQFQPLDGFVAESNYDIADFYPKLIEGWTADGNLMAIPVQGQPNVLFYNKGMFDAANLPYPTDTWTMEDMRTAAISLTLDQDGRNPTDPAFDPDNIRQWGLANHPGGFPLWLQTYLGPFDADICANAACTQVDYSKPEVMEALQWWYDLAVTNHAAPGDIYGGGSTGVVGDPFISQFAAMTFNIPNAITFIKSAEAFDFDIVATPMGPTGHRGSQMWSYGFGIPNTAANPQEAWKLIQELASPEFQRAMWGVTANGVPSRMSVASSVLEVQAPPTNMQAVLDAMDYATMDRPIGSKVWEAYINTISITTSVFMGQTPLQEGYDQLAPIINGFLAP